MKNSKSAGAYNFVPFVNQNDCLVCFSTFYWRRLWISREVLHSMLCLRTLLGSQRSDGW